MWIHFSTVRTRILRPFSLSISASECTSPSIPSTPCHFHPASLPVPFTSPVYIFHFASSSPINYFLFPRTHLISVLPPPCIYFPEPSHYHCLIIYSFTHSTSLFFPPPSFLHIVLPFLIPLQQLPPPFTLATSLAPHFPIHH